MGRQHDLLPQHRIQIIEKFKVMKLERHFGPLMLHCDASVELITNLNNWVNNLSQDEWKCVSSKGDNSIPDLLNRGFETLFLPYSTCDRLGLTKFLLESGQYYVDNVMPDENKTVTLPPSTFSDDYADVWVNRYFKGNVTPPHGHAQSLSGIIMMEIPDNPPILEFFYPFSTYQPPQYVGKTLMFPSDLMHEVRPQQVEEERRTLSFNLLFA
jgi:hypothetical protein